MATRQKSFSRSLIRSRKFWLLRSDKERLFYMLVLLNLDNIGRGLGSEYYLKGKLYEKDPKTSANDCKKYLQNCHDVGILISYEIEDVRYIQDPVHMEHNKIVGNMTDQSDFPEPTPEIIGGWQEKCDKVYTKFDSVRSEDKDKDKDEDKGMEITHPPLVCIPLEEQKKLKEMYDVTNLKGYVQRLNDYGLQFPAKFKKYKDHAAVIRSWMRRDSVRRKGAVR